MHTLATRLMVLATLLNGRLYADCKEAAPQEIRQYFVACNSTDLFGEQIAARAAAHNLVDAPTGRSFAVVVGISNYPNMAEKRLAPAQADIDSLVHYLTEEEDFAEVIVLRDSAVTHENLRLVLQEYLRSRVDDFGLSRFLFAFTGHGYEEGGFSYLLHFGASDPLDVRNGINLQSLKALLQPVVDSAQHSLVLLNACKGGQFLSAFGDGETYISRRQGAHAITAGAPGELVFADPAYGPGSLFFEAVLDGVRGGADPDGNGFITSWDLHGFIVERVGLQANRQTPLIGDMLPRNEISRGSFVFVNSDSTKRKPLKTQSAVDALLGAFGPPAPDSTPDPQATRAPQAWASVALGTSDLLVGERDSAESVNYQRNRLGSMSSLQLIYDPSRHISTTFSLSVHGLTDSYIRYGAGVALKRGSAARSLEAGAVLGRTIEVSSAHFAPSEVEHSKTNRLDVSVLGALTIAPGWSLWSGSAGLRLEVRKHVWGRFEGNTDGTDDVITVDQVSIGFLWRL